jgi:hypothetical protein
MKKKHFEFFEGKTISKAWSYVGPGVSLRIEFEDGSKVDLTPMGVGFDGCIKIEENPETAEEKFQKVREELRIRNCQLARERYIG